MNISTIQPLYAVSLGDGWSTGVSEMTLVYDWDTNKFTSLPLGVKISKLTRMGKVPIQFQATYEGNFYDDGLVAEDTIGFMIKILLPKD